MPKVPFQTKQEWLFTTLREMIETCELKPGQRLLLDQIAADFNVSRVPVREALLQLQSEGLVQMIPHSGAIVTPVDFLSASDYFAVSRELQVLAVKAFCERSSKEDLIQLETMVLEMEKAAQQDDRALYSSLNQDFHDFIADHCKMPLVNSFLRTYKQHWNRFVRFYHLYPMSRERMKQTLSEHRDLLNALVNRDLVEAERASRVHNITGLEDHLSRMKNENGI